MKIGIIGLGSIGQRHIKCLKKLGYDNIVALRSTKGSIKKLPEELNYIKQVYNYNDFFLNNLDGIIISNPTSLHIESLKMCLNKGIPIFVEKPIADSLKQIKEIRNFDTSKVMVGFNLRYNEMISKVKEFISSNKIGKIFKANLYCGQYLPLWHPYTDYRKEYYSRKDLGGGVLRTLSHEIDLMNYFFGLPIEVFASVEKISDLEIDVDDNVYMICKMADNSLVNIELDYLNPMPKRKGAIFSSKGKLNYTLSSFSESIAIFTDYEGKKIILYKNENYDWNEMYIQQMKSFVNFIKNKEILKCSFKDGINVTKVIETAELSNKSKSQKHLIEDQND